MKVPQQVSVYTQPRKFYYFTSMVYRTVSLFAILRDFQNKALFIDARIAEDTDLLFLKYAKALEWALTDTKLFESLEYDDFEEIDHLFVGTLHLVCESCWSEDGPLSLKKFQEALATSSNIDELRPILRFFDGLCADEARLRWSRLVAFHLLLMAFINSFGYDMQQTSEEKLRQIALSVRHPEILSNLEVWLNRLGLADAKSGQALGRAIRAAATS